MRFFMVDIGHRITNDEVFYGGYWTQNNE